MSNENIFLAYGEDRRAIEAVMRIHSVKRWHMIDTTRVQTLAEHSANVAMLAYLIAKTAPINFFDTAVVVASAGLFHDLPESFTGDIPSHTKRQLVGIDTLEAKVTPVELDVEHNGDTKLLIKLCDLADGIRFIRLHGVDLTARHAQEGLEEQLNKITRKLMDQKRWPAHLFSHVYEMVSFYAYEK